jgi:hypothetical protein
MPVRITRLERFGVRELFEGLRRVSLYGQPERLPYARADLTLLRAFPPDELVPAQLYVKRDELAKIARLAAALAERDVDLYGLDGWVRFWTEDGPPEGVALLPPVVECSREPDGPCVKLINDGMHRVYSARRAGRPITVVYAAGVPDDTPYYAYPNPRGWEGVDEVDEIGARLVKKHYRQEPHRALYRDFNTVFGNSTGFRPRAAEA